MIIVGIHVAVAGYGLIKWFVWKNVLDGQFLTGLAIGMIALDFGLIKYIKRKMAQNGCRI